MDEGDVKRYEQNLAEVDKHIEAAKTANDAELVRLLLPREASSTTCLIFYKVFFGGVRACVRACVTCVWLCACTIITCAV